MSQAHQDLITYTANLIRDFDNDLADAFLNDTFRRVDLAFAFAKGFAKNDTDDVHPTASLVIQVALFDRRSRGADPR